MSKSLASLLIDPEKPIIHRDLSWLQFNDRVLAEAEDKSNPLLERLKFLAITASNLDEFFMIRLASLHRELASFNKEHPKSKEDHSRHERINDEVLDHIKSFSRAQAKIFTTLSAELELHEIRIIRNPSSGPEGNVAKKLFDSTIVPCCDAPIAFSPSDILTAENLQLLLLFPENIFLRFPQTFPPVLWAKHHGKILVFFLDDLLSVFLGPALSIPSVPSVLRITRDADVSMVLSQDPASIPDSVRRQVNSRQSGKPMRLEYRGSLSKDLLQKLMHTLRVSEQQVFCTTEPLLLHGLYHFVKSLEPKLSRNPALYYPPLIPNTKKFLKKNRRVFKHLANKDYFFHLPYDSFNNYIKLIGAAAEDPSVTSIQQTIYRIDTLSTVTSLLKKAAQSKQVRVIIEPRARFDEINNISLAEELRSAGVSVVFSTGRLKLHAKLALITRQVDGETHLYTHVSTGNYNSKTASVYTDMAILTGNPAIGLDTQRFFDAVCEARMPEGLSHLVLAPTGLHRKIISLIHAETGAAQQGKPARIFAKVNALVDERIIEQLYGASQAGVKVDLVVRGACALLPGVPGLSENIRVISIVGRFLEHSRMYYFQHANTMFLSSADWMPRNFYSRLEIAFPVLDPAIFKFIAEYVIPLYLNDREKGRLLTRAGTWRARRELEGGDGASSQGRFYELARDKYKGTPIE